VLRPPRLQDFPLILQADGLLATQKVGGSSPFSRSQGPTHTRGFSCVVLAADYGGPQIPLMATPWRRYRACAALAPPTRFLEPGVEPDTGIARCNGGSESAACRATTPAGTSGPARRSLTKSCALDVPHGNAPECGKNPKSLGDLQAFLVVGETGFEPATARPPARVPRQSAGLRSRLVCIGETVRWPKARSTNSRSCVLGA
jgi:hypothetical protein